MAAFLPAGLGQPPPLPQASLPALIPRLQSALQARLGLEGSRLVTLLQVRAGVLCPHCTAGEAVKQVRAGGAAPGHAAAGARVCSALHCFALHCW